jgi:DNA-binding transcriptional regulator LsrR (DeoR family)
MALAAIRGKLVSVFVTDLNFALKILNLDKSTEADKA